MGIKALRKYHQFMWWKIHVETREFSLKLSPASKSISALSVYVLKLTPLKQKEWCDHAPHKEGAFKNF